MRITRTALLVGTLGLAIGAPLSQAATVKVGSPVISSYKGKPLAVVFFHPL